MTENDQSGNADARGWFVPPPDQPTDITLAGHLPPLRVPRPVYPDRRVWPPPPPPPSPDDEGYSTQPFPIIAAPLATARPAPVAPAAAPEPEPPAAPAQASPRRRGRRVLLVLALLLAIVLAVGAPGWFAYSTYKKGRPDDRLHTVPAGQPGTWQHVSWTAVAEPMPDPTGQPTPPDRQWMKIVITRTALDGEGAIRHDKPVDVTLRDRAGRTWRTEELSNETPLSTAENVVGQAYKIEMVGIVPTPVAGEVEVHLRPSTYRDVPGQSIEDMMKDSGKRAETTDDVLRFLR
ncbi:hypothetical protein Aph01nite_73670 [Acrocarpospora phusangensis]|uniref:DUF4352 domain-containing protein n=1 Tax=Acrocarpospora phusangensis TaxID=1070424 RepID=A0A919USD4_9ACTN|nr:hypothetical protein [Acrocarpospora phusangensis]GIH29057.1 hypothetical protein Aph01nite_73670 [Acrocarpospora phusangensis]